LLAAFQSTGKIDERRMDSFNTHKFANKAWAIMAVALLVATFQSFDKDASGQVQLARS